MSLPMGTVGSQAFDPEKLFTNTPFNLPNDDLRQAIISAFDLPEDDKYVYHAIASVTLSQVQSAISSKSANGLHSWYISPDGSSLGNPVPADISAYVSIFSPRQSAANTLKSLAANAKKGSLRQEIAQYLLEKRHLHEKFIVPKRRKPAPNPYFDFWAWSCLDLEWGGPIPATVDIKMSHHMLPVFMHHFGCVVPSYEALEVMQQVAGSRTVCDIGSGNGYWTLMLRKTGLDVVAVDNQQSRYRTIWIGDTVVADGVSWLKQKGGARGDVLLLVYPVTAGGLTAKVLKAYKGRDICIVGTQNANGYTGFLDTTIDGYMAKEMSDFEKTVQIPLPSFAGKDEALFVFQKIPV